MLSYDRRNEHGINRNCKTSFWKILKKPLKKKKSLPSKKRRKFFRKWVDQLRNFFVPAGVPADQIRPRKCYRSGQNCHRLGDSHAPQFYHRAQNEFFTNFWADVCGGRREVYMDRPALTVNLLLFRPWHMKRLSNFGTLLYIFVITPHDPPAVLQNRPVFGMSDGQGGVEWLGLGIHPWLRSLF